MSPGIQLNLERRRSCKEEDAKVERNTPLGAHTLRQEMGTLQQQELEVFSLFGLCCHTKKDKSHPEWPHPRRRAPGCWHLPWIYDLLRISTRFTLVEVHRCWIWPQTLVEAPAIKVLR